MFREVRKGGAYIGPYDFDVLDSYVKQGDAGTRAMREFFKHRHRLACMDQWEMKDMDGMTRPQTVDRLERIVLDNSELRGAI